MLYVADPNAEWLVIWNDVRLIGSRFTIIYSRHTAVN